MRMQREAVSESISPIIAEFIAAIDVPERVRRRATYLFLDAIGVALAASTFPFARSTADALGCIEGGRFPVIGLPTRLSMRDAGLVTGMLIHGIDFDDTSVAARIHPSGFCLPATLTLGVQLGSSGKDALTAYIAGLECALRIGAAAAGGFQRRGFYATGLMACFGGVFTASRLLGLSVSQIVSAQGVAYGMAAGNRAFSAEMAWTKRFGSGWGAASGITAAMLAKGGFMGPSVPYEGKFGLYAVHSDNPKPISIADLASVVDRLGENWVVEDIAVKPVPACYFNIPLIDAALRIYNEHKPCIADIESVRVLLPEAALDSVCEPAASKRRPTDSYVAQFSAYYLTASCLVRGKFDLDDVLPDALMNPSVLALADKVVYEFDPRTTFPKYYSGAVIVRMRDGTTFEAREDVDRGSAERPLSLLEIEQKFVNNASRVFPLVRVNQIRDMILDIDRLKYIGDLAELLAVTASAPAWQSPRPD
ncbi:MAG: MmgE/PrpD family protein [Pseudolabrys sp.]